MEGQSSGNRRSLTKHMVRKLSVCELVSERVGENVCACETDMNYGGEQSSGRKPS